MLRLSSVTILISVVALVVADFRSDSLNLHNQYRATHHSPELRLNDTLNNYAQNWAQNMANTNSINHSNGIYGENLFMTSAITLSDSDAVIQATTVWYNEVSKYDYNSPGFSPTTGHFTQVVWKNTIYLGIGIARSSSGVYVCGSYDPPGNWGNQFPQNVLKP